jgi:ABC-type cobalt transport system substrate-binding protein
VVKNYLIKMLTLVIILILSLRILLIQYNNKIKYSNEEANEVVKSCNLYHKSNP